MSAPVPETIFSEIMQLLDPPLMRGGVFLSSNHELITELMDRCERLAKVDACHASILKAQVRVLAGDLEGMRYWIRNAERIGARDAALHTLVICLANLGHVSEAAADYPKLMNVATGQVNDRLHLGLATGSPAEVVSAAESLERAGGTVINAELVMSAKRAAAAMAHRGATQQQLQQMMTVAGSVLREHGLIWLNPHPDFSTPGAFEPRDLSVSYRLRVSPNQAAEMTWELAERLASMDLMPEGITVGFIGEGEIPQEKRG